VSPYGALDLSGNVWEWVQDYYAPNFYQNNVENNPVDLEVSEFRVIRGGAFTNVESTARNKIKPGSVDNFLGFRCGE
jgi:formylglycine-generating enzyme required for sulfatase activity